MRLVTASEMREMDRLAINDIGIPGVVLMENAAKGATEVFMSHYNPSLDSEILVICGKGNNGGDGYVMARYLHNRGMKVSVIITGRKSAISGDAAVNLSVIEKLGIEISEIHDETVFENFTQRLSGCSYIIDGIFGTGLNSPVTGIYKRIIDAINSSKKTVIAIDIPSGVNSDTGGIMGAAVRADLTVTFGFAKPGHYIHPGALLTGRVVTVDIGIPGMISDRLETTHRLIGIDDFRDDLANETPDVHKGTRGHLLVIAGSKGKTGAAALAAMGALRAGAGLVTVGIPASLNSIMECKLTEAMTAPLPETLSGSLSYSAFDDILRLADDKTAIAIGPGLSTEDETVRLVCEIIKRCSLPMVIDADALNAISMNPEALDLLDNKKIVTPHPGEMGRLAGLTAKDIQQNRLAISREFAIKRKCNLVLKGAGTIVAEPNGVLNINPTGNPCLATGGTGDVLTGIISGLLARGLKEVKAAKAGVYIHGLAADLYAEKNGGSGMIASDLLDKIPGIMNSL